MTSLDLLHKIFDYLCYKKGDKRYYYPEKIKNEPPRYYRLLQIESLMAAFGLTKTTYNLIENLKYRLIDKNEYERRSAINKLSNLEYLLKGEFLNRKNIAKEYSQLNETIILNAKKHVPGLPDYHYQREVSIDWLYNSLIHYRIDIQRFVEKPTGFMEGFNIAKFYADCLEIEIAEKLEKDLIEIDNTLAFILDPEKRHFSISELVEKYDYPDVDLKTMDLDWLMKNY